MLSKRYESTKVDRRTWLQVPSGTPVGVAAQHCDNWQLTMQNITKRIVRQDKERQKAATDDAAT